MVQNGVRVSTFSDNTVSTRPLTYLAHMLGDQFPSRSREHQLIARNARSRSLFAQFLQPTTYALCSLIVACAGPTWPGGIHAKLAASPRGLRVVEVPVDSPAQRAGLQEGDAIVSIDGTLVEG